MAETDGDGRREMCKDRGTMELIVSHLYRKLVLSDYSSWFVFMSCSYWLHVFLQQI